MNVQFRPLNKVHELMNQIGFEPGYAYDDLVFSNDAIFIVQFGTEENPEMKLFINENCEIKESARINKGMVSLAQKQNLTINYSGTFALNPLEDTEELELVFST